MSVSEEENHDCAKKNLIRVSSTVSLSDASYDWTHLSTWTPLQGFRVMSCLKSTSVCRRHAWVALSQSELIDTIPSRL